MGVNPSKIHLIPMGINLEEWKNLMEIGSEENIAWKGKKSSFLRNEKL